MPFVVCGHPLLQAMLHYEGLRISEPGLAPLVRGGAHGKIIYPKTPDG